MTHLLWSMANKWPTALRRLNLGALESCQVAGCAAVSMLWLRQPRSASADVIAGLRAACTQNIMGGTNHIFYKLWPRTASCFLPPPAACRRTLCMPLHAAAHRQAVSASALCMAIIMLKCAKRILCFQFINYNGSI